MSDKRVLFCKDCLQKEFEKNSTLYNSPLIALKISCSRLDVPFHPLLYYNIIKNNECFGLGNYLRFVVNGTQFKGKTYMHTIISEETGKPDVVIKQTNELENEEQKNDIVDSVRFWGDGYSPEEYRMLDEEYSSWVINKNNGEKPNKSLETVFKQACQIFIDLQRARNNGSKASEISSLSKSYLEFLQSAGLKPIQEDNSNIAEKNSLGALIEKWEQTEPVPEISEDFRDVDKIKHYIDIFFKGHLCRMFGMKNDTQSEYDEEISQYTVLPPSVEEDGGEEDG